MLDVSLNPLDIIVFKGSKWNLGQSLIRWRSLSNYCHCITMSFDKDIAFDPDTDGMNKKYLSSFSGLDATICRPRFFDKLDPTVEKWCYSKFVSSKGYDFLSWAGFATGIKELEDENKWYCSEFPYWAFTENGVHLTNSNLTFIYPSFFVESPMFEIIFNGVL